MADDHSSIAGWTGLLKGLNPFRSRESSLKDRIADAIEDADTHDEMLPVEREMLRSLLQFGDRTAGDVAVPRSDIIAVPKTLSFAELVQVFAEAGHSRLPVFADSLDEIVGMVHIKDIFAILAGTRKPPATIAKLIRQPLYVPASRGVLDLLADMRSKRMHLAIVIDEYSGTEGLITIEDLVEEIVGEIEDEHDDAPVALLVALENGAWEADARAPLEDVANDIAAQLGEVDEDVDTLGGLAFVLAGHVPVAGEILDHPSGWKLEILDGDTKRVTRLRLHPPASA